MNGGTAHGLGPYDPYWTDEIGPPRRDRAWRGRIAVGLAVAAALVAVAALAPSRRSADPGGRTVVAGSPPVAAPLLTAPALALEGVEPTGVIHDLNLSRFGAGLSDALSLGRLDGEGPALRVEIWRDGGRRAAVGLFVAAAEIAAAGGAAVDRLGAAAILSSPSGPVEWAALNLAGDRNRDCAVFRAAPHDGGGLRGVVCAAPDAAIDTAALDCLLTRLTLTKAGREAGLVDLWKPATKRPACRTPLA